MLKERFERLVKIVADGGYRGEIIDKTKTAFARIPEIVYGQTIQANLSRYPKDGLLKERLLGLKAIGGLVKT